MKFKVYLTSFTNVPYVIEVSFGTQTTYLNIPLNIHSCTNKKVFIPFILKVRTGIDVKVDNVLMQDKSSSKYTYMFSPVKFDLCV